MPFKILKGDITSIKCDIIVNSSIGKLSCDTGVSKAIHAAAGNELIKECKKIGNCGIGECIVTSGYNLPCKYVVHTVAPIWEQEDSNHILSKCYKNAFNIAVDKKCKTIAFPLIAAGKNAFPIEVAAKVAINRIIADLRFVNNEVFVYLVLYDSNAYEIASELAKTLVPEKYEDYAAVNSDDYVIVNNEEKRKISIKVQGRLNFTNISDSFREKMKRVSNENYLFSDTDFDNVDVLIYNAYRQFTSGIMCFEEYEKNWAIFLENNGVEPTKRGIAELDSQLLFEVPLGVDKYPNECYINFKMHLYVSIYKSLYRCYISTGKAKKIPIKSSVFAKEYDDRKNGSVRTKPISFKNFKNNGNWSFFTFLKYQQLIEKLFSSIKTYSTGASDLYNPSKNYRHAKITNYAINIKRFLYANGICGRYDYEYINCALEQNLIYYDVYAYYSLNSFGDKETRLFISRSFDNFRMIIERKLVFSDAANNYCLMKYIDNFVREKVKNWWSLELLISQNKWEINNVEYNKILSHLNNSIKIHNQMLLRLEKELDNIEKYNSKENLIDKLESYELENEILKRAQELAELLSKWNQTKRVETVNKKKTDIIKSETQKTPKWTANDILYIHKAQIKCQKERHNIISATASLTGLNHKEILLNVNYCKDCNMFFMNYTTYEMYRSRYGVLLGNLRMESLSKSEYNNRVLADESPLKLCGYSVNQKEGYSSSTREYIISQIIDKSIMKKDEVVRYLEYFIGMNGKKIGNESALSKWKSDLQFTLNYRSEYQAKHRISKIQKYR